MKIIVMLIMMINVSSGWEEVSSGRELVMIMIIITMIMTIIIMMSLMIIVMMIMMITVSSGWKEVSSGRDSSETTRAQQNFIFIRSKQVIDHYHRNHHDCDGNNDNYDDYIYQ